MLKQEFVVLSLILIFFINFSFDKMIFSMLHVSGDRERFITASVRYFSLCNVWYTVRKVIVLRQREFNCCTCERPQYSRDLFRAEM